MENLRYYLPGSVLILIALLIVAVPEILIALAATFMVMLGAGALYIGHLARKSEKEWNVLNRWFFDDDLRGWCELRKPIFGRWGRES